VGSNPTLSAIGRRLRPAPVSRPHPRSPSLTLRSPEIWTEPFVFRPFRSKFREGGLLEGGLGGVDGVCLKIFESAVSQSLLMRSRKADLRG
jgi:hypothetical protein